jgi:hypothetical protein
MCHNVVGTGVGFRFKVIHFDQSIRRRRMSFGKTRHTDPEAAAIRMRARFVESANELHQIDRVLKGIPRLIVAASPRRIAAERKNISDAGFRISNQNGFYLVFLVADARQVRDRIQFCRSLNALNQIMGQISR